MTMARPDLTVPWNSSASLIGIRDLPIHGTVASCIRVWRAAHPDKRAAAMLATATALRALPDQPEAYTFKADAIAQLSARMPPD
jgi:hypothetical protein